MGHTDDTIEQTTPHTRREQLQEDFFRTIHAQARLNQKLSSLILEQLNLTFPQMAVLMNLHEHAGYSTMQHLAQSMKQTGGGMTSLVDKLFKAGLVTREAVPQDRRIVQVVLTAAGEECIRELHTRFIKEQQQICSVLSDDELEQFIRTTQKLTHGLEHALEQYQVLHNDAT